MDDILTGLQSAKLTEKEKAALFYNVFGGCEDWETLYLIATDKPIKEAKKATYFSVYVSRWKHTPKVKDFADKLKQYKGVLLEDARREGKNQASREDNTSIQNNESNQGGKERIQSEPLKPVSKVIDYTNPENQQRKLNELVNFAGDSKEALDALKTIIATQKDDKQAAKDQQIQRFYTPEKCSTCTIKAAFAKYCKEK